MFNRRFVVYVSPAQCTIIKAMSVIISNGGAGNLTFCTVGAKAWLVKADDVGRIPVDIDAAHMLIVNKLVVPTKRKGVYHPVSGALKQYGGKPK